MNSNEKIALITGSTRGIGLAIAKNLGSEGYCIVMTGTRTADNYKEAHTWFTQRDIPLHYIQADISNDSDRKKIVCESVERFGRIDVLVNNAGIAPQERRDLLDMKEESFDRLISVNAKAPLFLSQLIAKEMIEQIKIDGVYRKIIFITSCSSVTSSTNRAEYCVSKAAETMVATLFADRLAREKILVYEIRPGVIRTDMTCLVKDKYDSLFENGRFPISRWGEPEDIAQVVNALCSERFLYTTGNYIDVDGGFHIPRL